MAAATAVAGKKTKAEFDFEAFRTAEPKETPDSFATWYIEKIDADLPKATEAGLREGVRAVYALYTTFMSSPERKAQVAENKAAKAAAAAKKAAEPKPAKAAKAGATPKAKAKPAAATDLI